MALPTGIYKQIVNQLFQEKLSKTDTTEFYVEKKQIDRSEAITLLTKYLCSLLEAAFASIGDDADPDKFVNFANEIILKLGSEFRIDNYENNLIAAGNSILTAVVDRSHCDYPDIAQYISKITPASSLNKSCLFTGGNQSLSLVSELQREIMSSDEICLVVSFIKISGLTLLFKKLEDFVRSGKKLRVITTTYTKATDYKAVAKLAALPNTEIKISYDGNEDRLHAKAYLFLRKTGFDTAYIGSSNISVYALSEGREWNIKATSTELPQIIDSVRNSFESYWNDPTFETFILGRDDNKLMAALGDENTPFQFDYSLLDIMRAKDYQQRILEQLDTERQVKGQNRNLLVAATGTGKTVIAAFDYKRFREAHPDRNNFLFLVHREEILKQAMQTFRTVLGDPNFGEIWSGTHPDIEDQSHVFASKDLINSRFNNLGLAADYYDYIIIDEVHHAQADSYRKVLDYFKPKILLGLTATPFRMDGADVTSDFGGRIAAEINLPDALNAGMLAPFHYYGVTDSVDLEDVKWDRGRFVPSELSNLYTNNSARTNVIFKALENYLTDIRSVRAIGFCVSKEHANYMDACFRLQGLRSAVLTSENTTQERRNINTKLRNGKINYLFVVDLFNEGVDIPEVDTILFLRPTESLTVFLQQFGRGLRLSPGKNYLTVLDFVGHTRAEYNYHDRFRALIGRTSMSVAEEAEAGFRHLPLGCEISLEPKARQYIIENLRSYIQSMGKRRIMSAITNFSSNYSVPLTISSFLHKTNLTLRQVYKIGCWGDLIHKAGVSNVTPTELQMRLAYAVYKKWLSVDSYSYFSFLKELAQKRFRVKYASLSAIDKKRVEMFYYDLYENPAVFPSAQAMLDAMAADTAFRNELAEILDVLLDQCHALEMSDNSAIALQMPLKLHGVYTKAEIQVAIGTSTIAKRSSGREGVERNNDLNVEAMFVDIVKDREEGSTTNYNDFAQSRELFHWETQNRVSQDSKEGLAYINNERTMLLFVRQQATDPEDKGRTMGFVYCGEVVLESYSGNKPMQIVWRLKTPFSEQTYDFAATHKALG